MELEKAKNYTYKGLGNYTWYTLMHEDISVNDDLTKAFIAITKAHAEEAELYLYIAKTIVLNKLYPYDGTQSIIPNRYKYVQLRIGVYLFEKEGAEGESAHSEGGISRTYSDGDIPASLLNEITPFVKVL